MAVGTVVSLSVNGTPVERLHMNHMGPNRDDHCGFSRRLSGHDSDYLRTSSLQKGDKVFNWRTWTGLSLEELQHVERELGVDIPQGCLRENLVIEGIPDFSKLAPTSRLVFPKRDLFDTGSSAHRQAILAVWEENGPCKNVGKRLEDYHGVDGLMQRFVTAAKGKRGVMGFVLAQGMITVGDPVLVYPPTGQTHTLAAEAELEQA